MTANLAKAAIDYCAKHQITCKVTFDTYEWYVAMPNELHAVHLRHELDMMTPEAIRQNNKTLV